MTTASASNPRSQPHAAAPTTETVQKPRAGYIPTLDGWRAIAVLAVIAYHDQLRHLGFVSDDTLHTYGFLGVDLFFAISGILICTRLLEEEEMRGRISLKGFYIRRFFRILPPAMAYLAVVGLLGLAGVIHVGLVSWFCSLFFVNNYYMAHVGNPASPYTAHFWSLGIEEQFYLLLPGILFLFPRRRIAVLTAIAIASLAYPIWVFSHPDLLHAMGNQFSRFRTEMRLSSLFFPALLAVFLRRPGFRRACSVAVLPIVVIFVLLFALGLLVPNGLENYFLIIAVPCGFPFLLIGTTLHPSSLLSRFLELAPMKFVGRISYSLYLWQQLFFFDQFEHSRGAQVFSVVQAKPWTLAFVILVASASYFFLEKPMIRLGHRLAPPTTPGRGDLARTPG